MKQYKSTEKLLEKFDDLNLVTLALQREKFRLVDDRCLFESLLDEFLIMKHQLATDAKIVAEPLFGTAISTKLNDELELLKKQEIISVSD